MLSVVFVHMLGVLIIRETSMIVCVCVFLFGIFPVDREMETINSRAPD